MSTRTQTAPHLTTVAYAAASPVGNRARKGRETGARARGFPVRKGLNLEFFGGRTIENLTFTNVYLGGKAAWSTDDIASIDNALAAAIGDPHLNNVLAQYYADEKPTGTFKPSRVLEGPLPDRVFRDTVEGFVAGLDQSNGLSGFDLHSSVFNFLLPRGIVLVDGTSTGGDVEHDHDDDD